MKKQRPLSVLAVSALILLFCLNSALTLVSATNLQVSSKAVQDSFIIDLNEPAVYELTIKNLGDSDDFEIYSLVGIEIFPKEFSLNSGETKKIEIKAVPQSSLASKKESINFEYKIKDSKNDLQIEQLTIDIIGIEDAFLVEAENINPKSERIKIAIKNRINRNFGEVSLKIDSAFFSHSQTLSFNLLEKKELEIPLDLEKLRKATAGSYLLNTNIKISDVRGDVESIIKFLEQEGIETKESEEGFLVKRTEIKKSNVGNTIKEVQITVQKNIFSYLFTTFNVIPTETSINGITIDYTWRKELIPNDELSLVIKTNWFYPLLIIVFAVVLFLLIKKSVESDIILRKQVSYVKTRGGEFALKISLKAKAKRFIERINITDKLPPLVELYERYGAITPDKVDLKNKRMEWNIESLNEKEERIFSYIIYSKIGVVGKFELPKARAIYEKSGKIKEAESNRSFFINQPKE